MANKIQIKRSTSNATVTGLSNGELAFTANGNVFYIGDPAGSGNSIRIGGEQSPGTLTANQALVANSTSGIDKIIVANAAVSQLNANGATGTAGQVLTSAGANVSPYWANASGGGGSTGIGNSSILALNVNITANATINAGVNGFSVGPVNTANGVVVTITSGQRWVII